MTLAQAHALLPASTLVGDGLVDLPGLLVPDTLAALQQLAAGWRRTLNLPVVAVAGSNGKTTVTQMTAAILQAWQGDAALATAGNFNNHIGVPLTVLRLRQDSAV
ncbi:MAG: UDP-N-acetylmuramoylalanyl-D-glutamyl-2, 6-diaminopimelate--D-alanyl-D-alanine ligase, partial [Burkholderiales bacterium PBB5]